MPKLGALVSRCDPKSQPSEAFQKSWIVHPKLADADWLLGGSLPMPHLLAEAPNRRSIRSVRFTPAKTGQSVSFTEPEYIALSVF